MRRPREAGIVVLLLLGLSGCAGVPQRSSWTSPSEPVADGAEARPSGRLLSWWRRPRAEANTELPQGTAPVVAATSGSGVMARESQPASEVWPERRDGLLSRLPVLGRLWSGAGRDRSEESSISELRRGPGPWGGEVTAAAWPAAGDRQAQAADTAAGGALAARPRQAVRRRGSAAPPPSAAPAPTAVRPAREAEPSGEVTLEVSGPPPQPASGDRLPSSPTASDSSAPLTGLVPLGPGPQVDPAAIPASAAVAEAAPPPPAAPDPAPPAPRLGSQAAGGDADASQPPPPPPPTLRRTAPPPSTPPGGEPETTPPPSPNAPAAPAAEGSSPPGSAPSRPSATSTGTSAPTRATVPGSSPRLIAASAQGVYDSTMPAPVATSPHSRCSLHGRLCPLKHHGPLPSSQLPPATFPTTYESCIPGPGHAKSSPHGCGSPCECTPPVKVKKPCFLKTWLHKATCPGQGCGCCVGDCGSHGPAVTATSQLGVPAPQWSSRSPQGYDAATRAALSRWGGTEPRDVTQQ